MLRTFIHILLVRSIRAAFDASGTAPLSCRVPPRNRDRLDSCRAPHLESRGNGFPLICGCSSMVEQQLPKLNTRVRFPSPAPSPHYTEPMDFRRPARLRGIRGCSTKLCTRCRRPPAIEACASDRTRRGTWPRSPIFASVVRAITIAAAWTDRASGLVRLQNPCTTAVPIPLAS